MNFGNDTKKVLLIDNDLTIRFVFRKIINRMFKDVEMFTSSDTVEGLGYIFLLKSEVVIMDTTLPSYGGLEVLDYISSNKKLKELNPKIIVLYEDPKYINTKLGYTFIHKNDYHFLDKLINALSEKLKFNNYIENSNLFNLLKGIGSQVIKYSDKADLNFFDIIHSKNIFTKFFNSINWLANQIITSFYLAVFYIIGGRKVKELNIEQNKSDLKKFRFKAYPTIAMSIAGILLLLFQFGVFAGGFLSFKTVVQAASYTWDGGGTDGTCGGGAGDGNKWSCAANWSSDIVPLSTDTVTFNGTSTKDSIVDAGFQGTVSSMTIASGYTGTITQQRSLIVTTTFTQSAGTFTASNQSLTVTSTFTLNTGSIFTASSGNTTFTAGFTINGGTFNHNSGTVIFNGSIATLICNNVTFNLVTFNNTSTKTVNSNCSLPLGANPTMANAVTLNGTLTGSGTLSLTTNGFALNPGATLTGFTGLAVQQLTISGATIDFSSYSPFTNTGFTLSSGTVTVPNNVAIATGGSGSFILSGGTFNAPSGTLTIGSSSTTGSVTISGTPTLNTNGGTIAFVRGGGSISCGNITFNLVTLTISGSTTINSDCNLPLGNNPTIGPGITLNGTLSGTGTLTETGVAAFVLNPTASLSGFSALSTSTLTVAGATANFGSYSSFVNSSGVTLSSGTLTLPSGADLNAALTINGGTFNAPSGNMTIAQALTISGSPTFNHNNGTITFDGANIVNIGCNNLSIFNNVVISATGSTTKQFTNCPSVPLGNNPTTTRVAVVSSTLTGTGTLTLAGGGDSTFTTGGNISGFTGLSAQGLTITGANLNLSGLTSFVQGPAGNTINMSSGSLTLPNGADINGNLTISGGTFTAPSGALTIAQALTISGSPTFNANGGTINFDGAVGGALSCNNVTFNAVNLNHTSGTRTVGSNCTLPLGNNPVLGTASGSTGVTNNGTLTGTGTLNTGVFNFNPGSALTGFSGINTNSTFTVAGGTANFSGYSSFVATSNGPVAISSGTLTLPNGTDLNSNLSISGGTFNAPSGTMTLAGALTITGSPTFNHNNGTITIDGAGGGTLSCNNVTFNLVIFAHAGGTKTVSNNCSLPLGNNPSIGAAPGGNLTLAGTLTGSGTIAFTSQSIFNAEATLTGFSGLTNAGAFIVSGATLNLGSYTTVDLNNIFTFSSGTFTAPSNNMTLAGSLTISGSSVFNHNNGTVTFDGSTAILSCNNVTFNLVSFTGQTTSTTKTVNSNCSLPLGSNPIIPGSITLNGTLSGSNTLTFNLIGSTILVLNPGANVSGFSGIVANNFSVNGATINLGSYSPAEIGGDFTVGSGTFTAPSGTMTIFKRFTHSGGTFNHNNGTVEMNGINRSIIGSTTFYNLTKTVTSADTLSFTAGTTQIILNNLTLKGISGNILTVASTTPGSQWSIDPQGTVDIQYLSVTDSNNINANAIQTLGLNITNGGNNTNWNFNYPVVIFNNFNDGAVITDKTPTFNFNITDPDTGNTVKYQIQIDNNSDFSSPEVDVTSSLAAQGDFTFTPGTDLADGSYYLRIKATDSTNGTTGFTVANDSNVAFKVDTTAPTGRIYIGFGTNTGNDHDVYLIFNATDSLSGVKEMIYSENSNFSDASYINYQTAKIFRLSDGYGRKVVYTKYKDYVGNESIIYSAGVTLESQTTDSDTENPNNTPATPAESPKTDENLIVEIAVLMLDADNNPLKNVTLFLNGVEAITDEFGVAIFKNVLKGDNLIRGSVNGISFEQNINVDASTKVYKVVVEQKSNNELIYLLCGLVLVLLIIIALLVIKKRRSSK